jgi:hypothetical protein
MISQNALEWLTPEKLVVIQKHLKLGSKHILKCLSQEEWQKFYELAQLDSKTRAQLRLDKVELAGPATLALNSILTAALGGWMGFSGFIGLSLNSPILFIFILSIASLVGLALGYQNYQFTKQSAEKAIEKRRLQDIELYLLNELIKNRKREIKEKHKELIYVLNSMHIAKEDINEGLQYEKFGSDFQCIAWLSEFEKIVKKTHKDEVLYHDILKEIDENKKKTKEKLKFYEKIKENDFFFTLQKLFDAKIDSREANPSWFRANFKNLIIGLIPTFFGGFSSLFVYLNGVPNIAQSMGKTKTFYFFIDSRVKYIELSIAALITIYFAASFIYLNRKTFKRYREVTKTDAIIIQEEGKVALLSDQLLKVKEVLSCMSRIFSIYKIIKRK